MNELETKLKNIMEKISSTLRESPLEKSRYDNFLLNQLKEAGLVSGDMTEHSVVKYLCEISDLLNEQLSIYLRPGLKEDYIVRPETPFSEEMKKDMADLKEAVKLGMAYLKANVKEGSDFAEIRLEYEKGLEEYINKEFPSLSETRKVAVKVVVIDNYLSDVEEIRTYNPEWWHLRLMFEELREEDQPGLEEVKETIKKL